MQRLSAPTRRSISKDLQNLCKFASLTEQFLLLFSECFIWSGQQELHLQTQAIVKSNPTLQRQCSVWIFVGSLEWNVFTLQMMCLHRCLHQLWMQPRNIVPSIIWVCPFGLDATYVWWMWILPTGCVFKLNQIFSDENESIQPKRAFLLNWVFTDSYGGLEVLWIVFI